MNKKIFTLIIAFAALFIAAPAFAGGPFHCPFPFQTHSSLEGGGVFEVESFYNGPNFGTIAKGVSSYKYKGITGKGSGSAGGNTTTIVSFSADHCNMNLNMSSSGYNWSDSFVKPLPKIDPRP